MPLKGIWFVRDRQKEFFFCENSGRQLLFKNALCYFKCMKKVRFTNLSNQELFASLFKQNRSVKLPRRENRVTNMPTGGKNMKKFVFSSGIKLFQMVKEKNIKIKFVLKR